MFKTSSSSFFDLLLYGPLSILKRIWVQIILLALMFGFGTIIFMYFQGLPVLTAFLGSVSTITTIGIYAPDITHMVPIEQVFLIIMFIVSVGLAASIVQSTVTTAISRDILREQLVRRQIARLRGHVVVAGYSYLGKYVTEGLRRMKIEDNIIIVKDGSLVRSLQSAGLLAVYAPTEAAFDVLNQIRIQNASSLICTYEDDGDNLLMAMNAKKLNKDIKIVMVAQDKDIVESAKAVGVDIVIPIFDIIGQILALSAASEKVAGTFLTSELRSRYLAEFKVDDHNKQRQNKDILNEDPNDTALEINDAVMLLRNNKIICNLDGYEFKAGDSIFTISSHKISEDPRNVVSPAD
jgi:voltage-gated potassium channel